MIFPHVHTNGSSPDLLIQQYKYLIAKLDETMSALMAADINIRDYYPLGPSAHATAVREMQNRVRDLNRMRTEFQEIVLHLENNSRQLA